MGSFQLLYNRRFWPYFIAQGLGAFNDNLFKNIILLSIAFYMPSEADKGSLYINLSAALFILPFFLFSAHAGSLTERSDKFVLLKRLKLFEVALMSIASLAIYSAHFEALLVLLFLMGTQSAYFGPLKYSIIYLQVGKKNVVRATGLVELATFSVIIAGTLLAGVIMSLTQALLFAALGCLVCAVLGYLSALCLEPAASTQQKETHPSKHSGFRQTLALAWANPACKRSILLISWFWFLGASLLTQIPVYTAQYISDQPFWVSLILAIFIAGMSLGSVIYTRLSGGKLMLNKLPLCALVISICCLNLWLIGPHVGSLNLQTFSQAFASLSASLILLNFGLLGLFCGLFIVPLYALLQLGADTAQRSRMVAANNIMNAIFMVVSALLAIVLLSVIKFSILQYFMILGGLNAVYTFYGLKKLTSVV